MSLAVGDKLGPYEGWIAADPFRGGVRVLITGLEGFEKTSALASDEAPACAAVWPAIAHGSRPVLSFAACRNPSP